MALLTLALAADVRLICASKRKETARPAASSSGDTIFEPEDKRASDLASMLCDAARLRAPVCADMFVLITITNSFLESPLAGSFVARHPCRVVSFNLRPHRFPHWPFVAANRHRLATTSLSVSQK